MERAADFKLATRLTQLNDEKIFNGGDLVLAETVPASESNGIPLVDCGEIHMHNMQGSNINDAVVPPSSLTRRSKSISPRHDQTWVCMQLIYREHARQDLDPNRCTVGFRIDCDVTPVRLP